MYAACVDNEQEQQTIMMMRLLLLISIPRDTDYGRHLGLSHTQMRCNGGTRKIIITRTRTQLGHSTQLIAEAAGFCVGARGCFVDGEKGSAQWPVE